MPNMIHILSLLFVLTLTATQVFATEVVIYLTRHGKTMFNTVHRVQGWSDTPLTQPGITVAEQLGRGLKGIDFIAVYSSDSGRARKTAQIILATKGDNLPIIESEKLRETYFGSYEGDLDDTMWNTAAKKLNLSSFQELLKQFAAGKTSIDKMMNAIAAAEPNGEAEDYQAVKTRMTAELTSIAKSAQQKGGGNVLVVSHGMATLAFINDLVQPKPSTQVANASVTKIRYTDDGKFMVESVGDTRYIEKGAK